LLLLRINGVKIKVLVFGRTGLVGTSVVNKLSLNKNLKVVPASRNDANLFNLSETTKIIEKVNPDVVVNAAAKVGGILANNSERFDFIIENLKINMNILESVKPFSDIRVINLGSSCIYPINIENPIKESSIMTGKLEPTNSPYAMAKLTAIEIGDAMAKQFGHKITNLMPTNLYGPNDNFNPSNSHVIPGMIYKFHNAKILGEDTVKLWGDGTPLREFLFVDDLADSIDFIIEKNLNENILNIGSSEEISIQDLAKLIKEIIDYKGDIEFDESKPNGIDRKLLDSSNIFNHGWKPKTKLKEGISITYKWFQSNIDNLRL